MTNLSEVANMDWKDDLVSPDKVVAGSGIVKWLTDVINRLRNIINVDLGQIEDEDTDYYPTGGCCCF